MLLEEGYSNQTVSENIKKLISEGYKRNQAVAISMENARRENGDGSGNMLDKMKEDRSKRKLDRCGVTADKYQDALKILVK